MQNNDSNDGHVIQGGELSGDEVQKHAQDTPAGTTPESAETNELPPVQSDKARGSFDLLKKRAGGGQSKKALYLSIAGVVLVFLLILVGGWWWVISTMKEGSTDIDESTVKADATLDKDAGNDTSMKQLKEEKLRQMQAEEDQKAKDAEALRLAQEKANKGTESGANSGNATAGANTSSQGDTKDVPQTPAQRKLAGGVVVTPLVQDASGYGSSVSGASGPATVTPLAGGTESTPDVAQTGLGGGLGGGSSSRGSLSNLSGTSFSPGKAVLAPSRKYLLSHNTYTRCVLYTEIVTDQPSLIECPLTEPLYSADGSTVLADAGDRLFGEQSVEVRPGQVRVFTSWTELETQSGVRANLASLGAGPMGASGTEAWIDNHYMQRFGGAVMLSFIQDALEAAKNTTQKSSGGYTVNNSEQNTENMANKALESTIGIKPTAHILPGTVMTVIVARDIDFSSVFENR
ncbi:TrbI/VirB10 family protein [Pseudomonas sp. MF5691]|uniref:TrbI/VirB10 family protein n=1 Tax=Pseudomonas sp. MF5691 TaxID=2797526 RepID=UPI0018E811E8|nr:TrbI/VirB10 family protein [Pseudomonas sp. MF5691]MBJ2293277.1 TrbI/VirB10 family protein [Pseudomonas sp. MF5691]